MRARVSTISKSSGPSADLPSQYPHYPPRHKDSANEHGKAIQAVANLLAGGAALCDAKNYRSKHAKQNGGAEVGELQIHGFFPIAMW
jgi:hypothetical protein